MDLVRLDHVETGASGRSSGRRTLSDGCAWVSAVGASVLLDVERAAACKTKFVSALHHRLPIRTVSLTRPSFPSASHRIHSLFLMLDMTYRSVCTERASCCGACRSWRYPWLFNLRQHFRVLIPLHCLVETSRPDALILNCRLRNERVGLGWLSSLNLSSQSRSVDEVLAPPKRKIRSERPWQVRRGTCRAWRCVHGPSLLSSPQPGMCSNHSTSTVR